MSRGNIVAVFLAALLSLPLPAVPQGKPAAQNVIPLPDFTPLVKKQGPAVVNVITSARTQRSGGPGGGGPQMSPDDPFFEFFRRFMPEPPQGGAPSPRPSQGVGSGFIISDDGYILTNAHVVQGADQVTVRLADAKREFKAKVVGADERTDIALLKVEATDLPVATLGKSSTLEAGQWVAAIGSPFGFANTITAGIVSATQRALPAETYVPFIQTDVAVNPGNSGGPLINLAGEVVGVNSMIYSRTGGYMGVSFAIPIEAALDVAKQLRESGKVTRGRLGVGIQPLTKELAESFKLDVAEGMMVTTVEPGTAADKAGLQVGDVIVSYNGERIDDPNELPRLVATTKPGAKAEIGIRRGGENRTLTASIGELAASAATGATKPSDKAKPGRLGLSVRELSAEERKAAGVEYGLIVTEVAERLADTPLRPGDVIVGVGAQRFKSVAEFEKLIAARKSGERVPLLVRRGEGAIFVPVEVG